jgi:hypothetical protein
MARFHSLSDTEFGSASNRKEMFVKAISFLKDRYRPFLGGKGTAFPKVMIIPGAEKEGDFLVEDGTPTIRIFRSSDSWILTLFHEFYHFREWVSDPTHFEESYQRFNDTEDTFAERHAVEDWSDFARMLGRQDLEIPGTQITTYVRRHYGRKSRL